MKNYLIALFSGLLFPLGFAPFDIWPLTILSLSLILYLTGKTSLKQAFLVGWIYGIGLWGLGVSWVYVSIYYHGNQGLVGSLIITFVFVSLLSLYTGLVTYLFIKLKTNNEYLDYLIFFPVVWVSIEVLRSYLFTGFPWLIVGTSLAGTSIGGWIPILGSYGVSILTLMISGSLVLMFKKELKINWYPALIIMIILVSSFTLYKINWTKEITTIQASIYQPNLTLEEKWSSKGVRQTMALVESSVLNADEGEFIFFPETALIFDKE